MKKVNALSEPSNSKTNPSWTMKYEQLPTPSSTLMATSLEAPPIIELKPHPVTLKYTFLGSNDILSIIITVDLTSNQESQLVDVLKEYKEAIGWLIADLKGIDLHLYASYLL